MPLISLWSSNRTAIEEFSVEQVVAAAGDGSLRDQSLCSQELRAYLSEVTSTKLAQYVEYCLSRHFSKGGMVLQDLVNELGRRLEYKVSPYQAKAGSPTITGRRRTREAPLGIAPALSWS